MALNKKPNANAAAAAAAASTPAFEPQEDNGGATVLETSADTGNTNVEAGDAATTGTTANLTPASADDAAEAVKETLAAEKPAAAAAAAPASTSTAVAIPKLHAVATVSKKFVGALSDLENVFDPAALDFNTFPRIVVGLDGFTDQDTGEDLGKQIGIEVMSFNDRWTVSPGVDDEEAKGLVRFSIDGKTLDCPQNPDEHGMPVGDYLNLLRTTHGYKDAALKEYVAIYGFMTFACSEVVDPAERQIVGVQVPPVSRPLFDRYKITQGVLRARGVAPKHPGVRLTQEKKTGGGRKYAVINFAPEKDQNIIGSFVAEEAAAA